MSLLAIGLVAFSSAVACGPAGASDAASPSSSDAGADVGAGSNSSAGNDASAEGAPEATHFVYSNVPAPDDALRIEWLGGADKNDVWAIARPKGAKLGDLTPWVALHFDGVSWSTGRALLSMTNRALGLGTVGAKTYAGIGGSMYPLDDPSSPAVPLTVADEVMGLTSVGSALLVEAEQSQPGTPGPLYTFDGATFAPITMPSEKNAQSIASVWGVRSDDLWVARGRAQDGVTGGMYLPLPLLHAAGATRESFQNVPATHVTGQADDDVWAATFALGTPPTYTVQHYDGATWKSFDSSSVEVGRLEALSKDEVFVRRGAGTYDPDGYVSVDNFSRFDGTSFAPDARPGAPTRVGALGRVGKNELWLVHQPASGATRTLRIARLAPEGT